jgi:hypothetical protein
MGSGRFLAGLLAMAVLAGMGAAPSHASESGTPRIASLKQNTAAAWPDLPARFGLNGWIVDDEGNRIHEAAIYQITGNNKKTLLAHSDKTGAFEITGRLAPDARLLVEHVLYAPRRIAAGSLYIGENKLVSIEIIPYTDRFYVTPRGGTYKSGQLTLEVPRGAVREPITILAAQLPLDFAYNHDGSVEPVRLTSVDLKPHGLRLAKPVKLTMTIDREDLAEITDPVSFFFSQQKGRYIQDPDSTVEVDGQRITLTLRHFSPHATADGRMAQSTRNLGRGADINGDTEITPSDALFMVLASGGTQEASASYAQWITGSVHEVTRQATSLSRPFHAAGQDYLVSPALKKAAARQVAKSFSLGQKWQHSIAATLDVKAEPRGFDCKLLLGTYNFHHTARWQRIIPGANELTMIEDAWASAVTGVEGKGLDGHFEYFSWQETSRHLIPPSLPERHTIAVTRNNKTLEIFARGRSFIVATVRGAETRPCPNQTEQDLRASAAHAIDGYRGRKAQQKALAQNFFFGSSLDASRQDQDWGTLDHQTLKTHIDLHCPSRRHQVWNFALGEGGPAQIWTTPFVQEIESDGSLETSVAWTIVNKDTDHFSEHLTAGLFKKTPDGPVPFGFMLHKTAERPCDAAPLLYSADGHPEIKTSVTALSPDQTWGLVSRTE